MVAVTAALILAGAVQAFAVGSVTLNATPSEITYLDTVTLSATAVGADSDTATLYRRYMSSTLTQTVNSASSATGEFTFTDTPNKKAYYWVEVGSAKSEPEQVVLVHTLLGTPSADSANLLGGQTLHSWGTIRPAHPPVTPPTDVIYKVCFEKYNPSSATWETPPYLASDVANVTTQINADTSKWEYSRAFSNAEAGLWRMKFMHECPRHIATFSPPMEFTVSAYTPVPVYRFYNVKAGVHFYTADPAEKANVEKNYSATYRYEGVAYQVNAAAADNNTPLYRFYNLSAGVHFYTASAAERDSVLRNYAGTYRYEGEAYKVSINPASGRPVYRFYNFKAGVHFYTADPAEKASVEKDYSATYRYEGVGYYLAN